MDGLTASTQEEPNVESRQQEQPSTDFYYKREHQYDAEGLTPEERGKRRQDLESKEMLITLRQRLKIKLDKDPSETTLYLREALNYLDNFLVNIFAFLKYGNLHIDNNLAERSIRPLTT